MNTPSASTTMPARSSSWIRADETRAWDAAICATRADVFHSAWFHQLAQARGEGRPELFVWQSSGARVVLPLLLRDAPRFGDRDATSVYGYVGPACSRAPQPAEAEAFQRALEAALRDRRVVSVFSRLHPRIHAEAWLDGLGEIHPSGTTVSVCLQRSRDERQAGYRGSHRREIARSQRQGYRVKREPDAAPAFHRLYAAAMSRLGASVHTLFSAADIATLAEPNRMALFVARRAGDLAAAALFAASPTGAHYHLAATDPAHRKWAPSKLLIDAACDWARTQGAPWMHLGGGVGGAQDALFRFKSGFASQTHAFETWRWILDPRAYRRNCQAVGAPVDAGFFPAYRI